MGRLSAIKVQLELELGLLPPSRGYYFMNICLFLSLSICLSVC